MVKLYLLGDYKALQGADCSFSRLSRKSRWFAGMHTFQGEADLTAHKTNCMTRIISDISKQITPHRTQEAQESVQLFELLLIRRSRALACLESPTRAEQQIGFGLFAKPLAPAAANVPAVGPRFHPAYLRWRSIKALLYTVDATSTCSLSTRCRKTSRTTPLRRISCLQGQCYLQLCRGSAGASSQADSILNHVDVAWH